MKARIFNALQGDQFNPGFCRNVSVERFFAISPGKLRLMDSMGCSYHGKTHITPTRANGKAA